MTTRRMLAILLLLAVSSVAGAADPAPANPLEAMSWVVGGTWVTETTDPEGRPVSIEFECRWGHTGRSILYTIEAVSGGTSRPTHEGIYWWDPVKERIASLQVTAGGDVTEATVTVEEGRIAQENLLARADGTTQRQRAEAIRKEQDTFVFSASVPKAGAWTEAVRFEYRRRSGVAPSGEREPSAESKR